MKNNTFIKLLLVSYIVVGVSGIARFLSPDNNADYKTDFSASSGVRHFSQTDSYTGKSTAGQTYETETEVQSETGCTAESVPSSEDDIFVRDEWLNQIDDFLGRVSESTELNTDTESDYTDETVPQNNNAAVRAKTDIPVIIDTDFASDADDVVAVRLAMCFQDAGLVDIRGIALSTTYSHSPLALHALCHQDGYGNIPVAMDTSGNGVQVHTDYVDAMYAMPKSRDDYEQPVQMYRRILSGSDAKVNIITLGFLQNIQGLMDSRADRYSPLTGMELISQKVDTIYIVGGNSTGKPSFNFYWTGEKVISAAKDVARNFPARIVFLQTDLSDDTYCGQLYGAKDSHQHDIVTKALKASHQDGGVVAWDVFSVWCAVQDMCGNSEQAFLGLEQGTQYVSDTGATEWTAGGTGRHFKMYKNREGAYYSELMNNMLLQKYDKTHNS